MAEPHEQSDGQQSDGQQSDGQQTDGQQTDGQQTEGPKPAQRPVQQPDAPVLPDRSADDSDEGWGDRGSGGGEERDDDWYQRERPPHW